MSEILIPDGETATVLSGTLSFSGVGTTAAKAGGPYAVTPGGVTAANYSITFGSAYAVTQEIVPPRMRMASVTVFRSSVTPWRRRPATIRRG